MSEYLPEPDPKRFPQLGDDPRWVRRIPEGTLIARIFRASGAYPVEWHEFRSFGPLDGRFDPHPLPVGEHEGVGVMYGVLESSVVLENSVGARSGASGADDTSGGEVSGSSRTVGGDTSGGDGAARAAAGSEIGAHAALEGPFAAALLEVFQAQRMIRLRDGAPTLAAFEVGRPLRLLDLSDSDWITVAGGNSAISSGDRERSRLWARAIAERYPELDGVVSASSLIPTSRVVALWAGAADALPEHPTALLRLDRDELLGVIDRIAERYGYLVL